MWLSDVCRHKEEQEIHLLIGAGYLRRFQTGCAIRGKADEPVVVERAKTGLVWAFKRQRRRQRTGTAG